MRTWFRAARDVGARTLRPSVQLALDKRGAIAVFLAFAIIPLVGFMGIGVDAARAYLVKSRLSSALDAAGLAGGRGFLTATRDDDIRMFFGANFPPGSLGASVTGPTITVDADAGTITLEASATLDTTFMHLFGFETVTVASSAEVTRQIDALDAVLAIDMSGSMSRSAPDGGSRIQAARTAAATLVDILFGDEAVKDRLNIGLVPWNGKVNVGRDGAIFDPAATVTEPVPGFINLETGAAQSEVYLANTSPVTMLAPPPPAWRGCVFNRFLDDGEAATDADTLLGPVATAGADWPAWQPVGPEGEPVSGRPRCALAVDNRECTPCLGHGITPLQNQKQTILDAVAALTEPGGTTNIAAGLGWAWRVLKPDAPFTEALADPGYDRQQAIVLLTDGENFAGSGDGYRTVFGYGNAGRPGMDARLRLLADNVKADGVIIYVIQFANDGTALQALLKDVASGPDSPFYNYAPDAATLERIFREVADHLSELRLSR